MRQALAMRDLSSLFDKEYQGSVAVPFLVELKADGLF